MGNKAVKGAGFERELARQLSLWWTQNESTPRDDIFWRTSTSGARATTRSKKGEKTANQYADISATDPIGFPFTNVFTMELKRGYTGKTLFDLIDPPKPKANQKKPVVQVYEEWIDKTISTHKASGTHSWALVVRRDQRPAFIVLPLNLYADLANAGAGWRFASPCPFVELEVMVVGQPVRLCCMRLDTFLTLLKPEHVKKLAREHANDQTRKAV